MLKIFSFQLKRAKFSGENRILNVEFSHVLLQVLEVSSVALTITQLIDIPVNKFSNWGEFLELLPS